MVDFAIQFDPVQMRGGIVMEGADFLTDDSLRTALLISLFTDREAEPDDILPDDDPNGMLAGSGDRRGWWGDFYQNISAAGSGAYAGAQNPGVPGDRWGSRLWLLDREKDLAAVLTRAQFYLVECTAWIPRYGIADSVLCEVESQGMGPYGSPDGSSGRRLAYRISVRRGSDRVAHQFDDIWRGTVS